MGKDKRLRRRKSLRVPRISLWVVTLLTVHSLISFLSYLPRPQCMYKELYGREKIKKRNTSEANFSVSHCPLGKKKRHSFGDWWIGRFTFHGQYFSLYNFFVVPGLPKELPAGHMKEIVFTGPQLVCLDQWKGKSEPLFFLFNLFC